MKHLLAVLAVACCSAAWAQAPAPSPDVAWPKERKAPDGTVITVYQPQLEQWADNRLSGRAAVAILRPGEKEPGYGVIELAARTEIDKSADTVTLSAVQITKGSFPGATQQEADTYLATLRGALPKQGWPASLQALQANLAIAQAKSRQKGVAVKNDPPQILFRTAPSLLVMIDGKPSVHEVKEAPGLKRVVNSTALILLDDASSKYYLWALDKWWETKSLAGEWTVALPPTSLDRARDALAKSFEPIENKDADGKPRFDPGAVPQIIVATQPTELLQSKGEPKLTPIPGTQLLYMENSSSDIFMELGAQTYYVLISGRWFSAKKLAGPWAFAASKSLPADFAKIPAGHPMADVLASIAGTAQANEAAIANQIPQTATVQRDVQPTPVKFDGGEPQWKAIDGTPLHYAVNTGLPVIRVDPPKSYYMVQNGVWFVAAAPAGPWSVASSVPAVIYTIPPSSSLHYVTYVRVYSSTQTAVVVGYTPGYYGTVMSSDGVVVYGTGYVYPPYISPYYPYYWYPPPPTYGYGFGFTVGFFFGFAFGPPWHYGGCCWGGPPMVIHHNNISINNSYNRWGGKSTSITGPGGRNVKASQVGNTTFAKGSGSDNLYAGRDGNVYRRDASGDWEKYQGKGQGWSDVDRPQGGDRPSAGQLPAGGDRPSAGQLPAGAERPSASQRPSDVQRDRGGSRETAGSLDRQYQSRQSGDARAQQFRSGGAGGFQGGGGMRGGGGFGGGGRGGGGRR
jgi:uncharacterized membrane protein YgcG